MGALRYSISVSIDGFVADRDGGFGWGAPDDALLRCHHDEVAGLGAYLLGRRLHETMRVWETEPAMRATPNGDAFADVWAALPRVVFSRTLDEVPGSSRLATRPLAEEVAAALAATDRDVSIGGADLAGQAVELDLVDELRVYRCPVVVGGGTRHLPPVAADLAFALVDARTFASGVVLERYARDRS